MEEIVQHENRHTVSRFEEESKKEKERGGGGRDTKKRKQKQSEKKKKSKSIFLMQEMFQQAYLPGLPRSYIFSYFLGRNNHKRKELWQDKESNTRLC